MSNVTVLPVVTSLDIPVDRVIRGAEKANLTTCVVIGYDQDGELYFASSVADGGDVLWLMELAKKALMNGNPNKD